MIGSATLKYNVPNLEMSTQGQRPIVTFQLRDVIFQSRTNYHASYLLPHDRLLEFDMCDIKVNFKISS